MSSKLRLITSSVVRPGSADSRQLPVRTWTSVPTMGPGVDAGPTSQLERLASHAGSALSVAGSGSTVGQVSAMSWWRVLSPMQIDMIYQRCPDVRAAIDAIVRQVATHDWEISPRVGRDDPEYEELFEACVPITQWLSRPVKDQSNQDTWQEVMTAVITDLLKHDAGVMERVRDRKGRLIELPPLRGPDVFPIYDRRGKLERYEQFPFNPGAPSSIGTSASIKLTPEQILYMELFPNTMGPLGMPLIESLIYQVIAIMRSAELWAHSVDMNEVPPGILVLVGVAKDAEERIRADYEAKAAADWKIRILGSPDPGTLDAKWVEFRKAPRELQLAELADKIQRIIWRVFGVTPVEMGDPGGTNRATAEVQMDVSGSHLITPILKLLAAKFNSLLIEDLVDPKYHGKIEFRWVNHRELTPSEKLARSQELIGLVGAGIMTRDEARREIGLPPYSDNMGSVPLVTAGKALVRLIDAIQEPVVEETGDGSSNGPSEDPDDSPASKTAARTRAVPCTRDHDHEPYERVGVRSWGSAELPAGWDTVGGALTLDLRALWDEMIGYRNDVSALWDQARGSVLAAVTASQTLDAAERARLDGVVTSELTGLLTAWAVSTLPRYRRVAESARRRAGDWLQWTTGADAVRAEADAFHLTAMGYLAADGGLVQDLRAAVSAALLQSAARSDRGVGDAIKAVGRAFDAAAHRIWNWASAMMGLANQTLSQQVASAPAATTQAGVADEAWCEWADVGPPEECKSCADYGSRGWMLLANLSAVPGDGSTECRGNCRCVLRVVWRSEIDAGTVQLVGHGNQP
jgi:hypothetical protein